MGSNKSILVAIAAATMLAVLCGCQESEKSSTIEWPETIKSTPTGQPQPEVPQPEEPAGITTPIIKVENPVHDFGEIRPKSVHKCVFKFKNVGDGILKIDRIQSTCGCIITQLKKKEYAPGESGEVKVTYTSPATEGKIKPKKLYILSNDPKNKRAPLTIKATVVLAVSFNPKKLNLKLKAEEQVVKPIVIKSKDGKPFSIKSFKSTNNAITAPFNPNEMATEFTLQPEINLEVLRKRTTGNITIEITPPPMTTSKTRIFRDKLTITLKDGSELTVNCTGIYKRIR